MREGTHEVHESVGSAEPVPEQSISRSLEQIAKSGGGKERSGERLVCPRCGKPVTYLDKKASKQRVWYIAVHEKWVKGERERKRCWLGSPDKHPELLAYLMKRTSKMGAESRAERLVELASDVIKTLSGLGDAGEKGLRKLRGLVEECLKAGRPRDGIELSPEVVNALSSLRGLVKGLVDAFNELKGRRVRVVEVDGKRVEGRVLRADEAFLRVEYEFRGGKAVASIPWTSIEKVEELKK
jgi:hypothetical protein